MNSMLDQLHDIEGLDAISRWPLAIGWWILIVIGLLIAFGLIYFVISKIRFKRSWKYDAFQKLLILEKNVSDATARETLMILSEYLRRIALKRFSRKECAGLAGSDWLKWLTQHDPKNFDWEKKGTLLTEEPYAPMDQPLSAHQVKDLIQAVKQWVR